MNNDMNKPLSKARKQCIALFFCGLLMAGVGLAMPTISATLHYHGAWAQRTNWRLLGGGLTVSGCCVYLYFTKKDEE